MRRKKLAALGVVATLALLVTVVLTRPAAPGPPAAEPYLTVFLIDGLAAPIFERELAAGHLPELQRLIDEGTYVPHGIGAFPSMTGYAFYPFLTGKDATTSGVLGLRWFHRGLPAGNFRNYVGRTFGEMNRDFVPAPPTLFERTDRHTFSIQSYANRGVHEGDVLGWDFSMAKYQEQYALLHALARVPGVGSWILPDWFAAERAVIDRAIADLDNHPKVQWVTFSSPDGRQHITGFDDTYPALLRHIDGLIGRYRAESSARGLESQRVYAVVSDHGVVDVSHNLDMRRIFSDGGLKAWRGEATILDKRRLDDPLSTWADSEVIAAVNGNTMNWVYLRAPGGWQQEPEPGLALAYPAHDGPVDIVRLLVTTPGIEMVATRVPGGVLVASATSRGRIDKRGDDYAYTCDGDDPLGYARDHRTSDLCDSLPRPPAVWLDRTHDTDYPYAVPRLYDVLNAEHAGEVVVLAKPGYDLAADYELVVGNYHGGHGGLRADSLRVPYILAGPGVPHGQVLPAARAEDVGAALLKLLHLGDSPPGPLAMALAPDPG